MKKVECEVCGSKDIVKDGDSFICQVCGAKYTPEAVQKLFFKLNPPEKNNGEVAPKEKTSAPKPEKEEEPKKEKTKSSAPKKVHGYSAKEIVVASLICGIGIIGIIIAICVMVSWS